MSRRRIVAADQVSPTERDARRSVNPAHADGWGGAVLTAGAAVATAHEEEEGPHVVARGATGARGHHSRNPHESMKERSEMSAVHTKPARPGLSADDDAPAPKRVLRRSRRGRLLLIAGVALVVLAAIFRLAIVPGMLKLPTNLDATGHFAGEQL